MRLLIERAESSRRGVWSLALCLLACLAALACQPREVPDADSGEQAEAVVAWVDGEQIGVDEVLAARRRGRGTGREALIEAAVLDKVASLEARRRKLHERPEVERALRRARVDAKRREQQILREALKQEIVRDVEFSESELRQAYQENERSYVEPQLRIRRWSFESEQEARGALEGAGEAGALDPGEATEEGPFSLRNPPPSYARAMGRLRHPGDRVVVESEGNWMVLELAGLVTDAKTPFEEVRDRVLRRLQRSRAEEMLEEQLRELRASADVRIDQAVLSDEELWRRPR